MADAGVQNEDFGASALYEWSRYPELTGSLLQGWRIGTGRNRQGTVLQSQPAQKPRQLLLLNLRDGKAIRTLTQLPASAADSRNSVLQELFAFTA